MWRSDRCRDRHRKHGDSWISRCSQSLADRPADRDDLVHGPAGDQAVEGTFDVPVGHSHQCRATRIGRAGQRHVMGGQHPWGGDQQAGDRQLPGDVVEVHDVRPFQGHQCCQGPACRRVPHVQRPTSTDVRHVTGEHADVVAARPKPLDQPAEVDLRATGFGIVEPAVVDAQDAHASVLLSVCRLSARERGQVDVLGVEGAREQLSIEGISHHCVGRQCRQRDSPSSSPGQ